MIDALGFTEAGHPSFLPQCDRARAPVRSVLGYSSAAIPTIMSGQLPERHGHFSMYRRAGGDGVFRGIAPLLRLAPRLKRGQWRLRRLVSRYLRLRGITGYFSLYDIPLEWLACFDLCQRRNLYEPRAFPELSGLADELSRAGRYRVWDWGVPEARAFQELEAEIARGERAILFLYTSELDSLMHAAGPQSEATGARLREYERRITRAMEQASARYREVRVFVFGDHGMAPVSRTHDLMSPLAPLRTRVPRECL